MERIMPAITALAISAAVPLGRLLAAFGARVACSAKRVAYRLQNRRDAMRLASLDDRMLADIGLTRSDLRDAYAEPLWHDPTDVLARRAAERRVSLRQAVVEYVAETRPSQKLVAASRPCRNPPVDRPPCRLAS
jgi:uncharacterized protein YjiS (DUF1127 family)